MKPKVFHLECLSASGMHTGVLPWEFKLKKPIPEIFRRDKKQRQDWITNRKTEHHVYTFNEGVNPNLRISNLRSGGAGNPIHSAHALVGDYDSNQPEELVIKLCRDLPYAPNWAERTLSGNWRFVWLLESPLIFVSSEFAVHFFRTFSQFAFDPALGMVGFDAPAWCAPERLYTNSCDWRKLHDELIPSEISQGWLVQASQTFQWSKQNFGACIPLEIVKEELGKKYPRFAEWPDEFVLESQGPTFWIDQSTSPKSAIVREAGIQTFSAHAAKGFYSWADLLDIAFVNKYQSEAIGRAVEGIYFDGNKYFRYLPLEQWSSFDKPNMALHLRTTRGVSSKKDKQGNSDVDRCFEYVNSYQKIAGAAPFAFHPHGLIKMNGETFLNTHTTLMLQPSPGPVNWGAGGQFPWLSNFFDRFFDPHLQLEYFIAWASVFYKSGYYLKPQQGHAVILVGGVGVGKTLTTTIMGHIAGGCADATKYLLGEDSFGGELFYKRLWISNDGAGSSDWKSKNFFAEVLKAIVANDRFRYHEKFRQALLVEWLGRVIITCNSDEESIRRIPNLDISNRDKLMLFRTTNNPLDFPSRAKVEAILNQELPFFCRYLLDYEIPEHLRGSSRYLVKSYAEPSLIETTQHSSAQAGFNEVLEDWKRRFFDQNAKLQFWEGTAYQLHKAIVGDEYHAVRALRSLSVDSIGKHLSALKAKGANIEWRTDENGLRIWRIHRAVARASKS